MRRNPSLQCNAISAVRLINGWNRLPVNPRSGGWLKSLKPMEQSIICTLETPEGQHLLARCKEVPIWSILFGTPHDAVYCLCDPRFSFKLYSKKLAIKVLSFKFLSFLVFFLFNFLWVAFFLGHPVHTAVKKVTLHSHLLKYFQSW